MPSPSHVSSVITEAQVIIMAFKGNSAAAEISIIWVLLLNSYCTLKELDDKLSNWIWRHLRSDLVSHESLFIWLRNSQKERREGRSWSGSVSDWVGAFLGLYESLLKHLHCKRVGLFIYRIDMWASAVTDEPNGVSTLPQPKGFSIQMRL
jgi:hypothetical protein